MSKTSWVEFSGRKTEGPAELFGNVSLQQFPKIPEVLKIKTLETF